MIPAVPYSFALLPSVASWLRCKPTSVFPLTYSVPPNGTYVGSSATRKPSGDGDEFEVASAMSTRTGASSATLRRRRQRDSSGNVSKVGTAPIQHATTGTQTDDCPEDQQRGSILALQSIDLDIDVHRFGEPPSWKILDGMQASWKASLQQLERTCASLRSDLELANKKLLMMELRPGAVNIDSTSQAVHPLADVASLQRKADELRMQRDVARLKALSFKGRYDELKRIYEPCGETEGDGSACSPEFTESEDAQSSSMDESDDTSSEDVEDMVVCRECYKKVPASSPWKKLCEICLKA